MPSLVTSLFLKSSSFVIFALLQALISATFKAFRFSKSNLFSTLDYILSKALIFALSKALAITLFLKFGFLVLSTLSLTLVFITSIVIILILFLKAGP